MEPIMDESTFQRELNKYKVVRPADYHKSRTIKAKSDPKSGARPAALTGTAPSPAPAPTPISRSAEVDFWELLSASNSTFMSTADSIKFIEILKEEHSRAAERLSLYDLDAIAADL